MSRVFPNSSLKRCNQPRPISFKLLDQDMWNSDRVFITSSPFKQWAKRGAICSCFAWNLTAYEGLEYLAFHHMEQCGEIDHTILEHECLHPSSKLTDIWKQCSVQGKSWIWLSEYYFRTGDYFKLMCEVPLVLEVPNTFQLKFKQRTVTSPL